MDIFAPRSAVRPGQCLSRRRWLAAVGLALLGPARAGAAPTGDREHRPQLDLPILAEDPAVIPVRVWVDHPMDPDHYIRALEVVLETDPVPRKGRFLFSPDNGQAAVAFQMRSGAGGVVRAVAECTRHGRFTGERELRVAPGGCTSVPDRLGRERLGNPMLRLPRRVRAGEVFEVRAKVDHSSHTGLVERDGTFVRVAPEFYVRQMLVYLDGRQVSEFQMTSAVSPHPLIRFPLRATRSATVRVVFVNSEGQRWEVAQPLEVQA